MRQNTGPNNEVKFMSLASLAFYKRLNKGGFSQTAEEGPSYLFLVTISKIQQTSRFRKGQK